MIKINFKCSAIIQLYLLGTQVYTYFILESVQIGQRQTASQRDPGQPVPSLVQLICSEH